MDACPRPESGPTEVLSSHPAPGSALAKLWALDRPWAIAHRGLSGLAPENTLAAVDMALDVGADMLEIDVSLTSDGHLVVLHDETLERTTSGAGAVRASSLQYVRSLDAGSWFEPRFGGEKVPVLSEVLERIRGRMAINVEIKAEAVDEEVRGGVAEKVVAALHDAGMAGDALVSSFEPRALEQVRLVDSALATGALYNREIHRGVLPSTMTGAVGARTFHVNRWYLRWSQLRDARAHGIPVLVYTVNRKWQMRALVHLGVRGLFTDRADWLMEVLGFDSSF